jgi:hypothetical protein
MSNFLKIVFGDAPLNNFAAYMVLAIIGIFIKLLLHVVQRNQASPNTPVDFSICFMLKDNAIRLMASLSLSLFVVFACIRFTSEILHVQLSPFVALGIGLASDYLAEQLKNLASSRTPFTGVATLLTDLKPDQPGSGDQPAGPAAIDPEKPAIDQIQVGPIAEVKQIVQQDETPPAGDINGNQKPTV